MPEDPYSDPVTGVLYNKLGLGTAAGLEAAEREITHAALILVDESPVSPSYDLPHLQEIHKWIFGDIYQWAGQIRTVAIAKGAMFCLPQYIDSSAAVIFGELHDEDCLRGRSARATGGRSAPSSGSSPATPGSRLPGSTLIPPATSRPPPRSCVATPNRCARCWTRSREAAPDHPSYARRQRPRLHRLFSQLKDHICLCVHNPQCKR
jgi:hypothetical protein